MAPSSRKRPKMAVTPLDGEIFELAMTADHKTLALWAADCAERALPFFDKRSPQDSRPRDAIDGIRDWARTGVFHMKDVRGKSLAAHAAARSVAEDDAARSAARSAGQAMATAHVPAHAVAAAIYAATAFRDKALADGATQIDADKATLKERGWQYRRLQRSMRRKNP